VIQDEKVYRQVILLSQIQTLRIEQDVTLEEGDLKIQYYNEFH